MTERDRQIFSLLNRYRYLPSDFLLAFVGGHPVYHRARLTDLYHEGWLKKPVLQWEVLNARYRCDVYELGTNASAYLRDEDALDEVRIGTSGAFRHELMVSTIMASFELSARRHGITLKTWKDILAKAPAATRESGQPFAIPTRFAHLGKDITASLRPDGLPFGCVGRRAFWFLGIEADRHSEPVHPTDLLSRPSSILRKLLQYQHVIKERLFERYLGLPNVFIPIITVNEAHMRNMIALSLELTSGQGAKWLLLRTMPEYAPVGPPIAPRLDLLAEPWERPGNAPLVLKDELFRGHSE